VLCYGKDPSLRTGNGRRPDGVNLNQSANAAALGHPCPKPVALWEWFIDRLSFDKSDLFFEPFSGSGTTIIACEIKGRTCYAMELSPQYVDMAVRRWQDFTGKQATLEATGQTFVQVQADRIGAVRTELTHQFEHTLTSTAHHFATLSAQAPQA